MMRFRIILLKVFADDGCQVYHVYLSIAFWAKRVIFIILVQKAQNAFFMVQR